MQRYFKNKAILLFDEHAPFQHKKLWQNKINLIKSMKFDKIILGGDFLDCYAISRFDKSPHRAEDLHFELTEAMAMLKDLRTAAPNAEIIFVKGNHCERLDKLLDTNLRAFRNLPELKLEKLLKLEKYNIRFVNDFYRVNKTFIVTHGVACCKQSAKAELEKWGISLAAGHIHRYNTFKKNYDEKIHKRPLEAYSFGCGADIDQLEYAKNFRHNWDNTFGIIEYNDTLFNITTIHPSKTKGGFYNPLEGKFYGKA